MFSFVIRRETCIEIVAFFIDPENIGVSLQCMPMGLFYPVQRGL